VEVTMLKIKRIKSYSRAIYPRGTYYEKVELLLDGYDSKLKIGYEYISEEEDKLNNQERYFYEMRNTLPKDGPYIRVLNTEAWTGNNEMRHERARK
jgi:hypothetical protein